MAALLASMEAGRAAEAQEPLTTPTPTPADALAAATPSATPSATPTPTPTPIATPLTTPLPSPSASPSPGAEDLKLGRPKELPAPVTADPDEPVARVKGKITVRGDKPKKAKKQKEEKIAGEVKTEEKAWLNEVCPVGEKSGSWLDRGQDRLGWSVCRATLWFDGLFGDERAVLERDATYGYVQPRTEWSEHDGVDPKLRFRAKYNLPLADRRFNALLGRTESDDDDQSSAPSHDTEGEQLPQSFRDADDEWLVGLGYSPVRSSRRRIDFDAGVKIRDPPDLFVQGRYRRHWFLSERDLIRARQTVFWRSDDGAGTSLNLDFERVLRGVYVVRFRNGGTYAQELEGIEWFGEVTLFHRLGEKTALAYVLSSDGATDAEVPVRKYTAEVIYRRNILRPWLYMELRPGLEWRKRERELDREFEPVMGVGLQIHFGDREFE